MARVSTTQRTLETRVANPLLRWLLCSPLHRVVSGRLLLISYVGRRSGRRYTFPVAYAESAGAVVAVTPNSETNWWKAFRTPHECTLWLRGRERAARGVVVDDEDREDALLVAYFEKNGSLARMLGLGGDPATSADALARAKRALAVVRFTLDG